MYIFYFKFPKIPIKLGKYAFNTNFLNFAEKYTLLGPAKHLKI